MSVVEVDSNIVTVTISATALTISITVSPTQFTASGGTATITGTTNLPVGTLVYAYVNNVKTGTGVAVATGGGFTTTVPIAANTLTTPVSDTIQVKNV